MLVSLVLFKKVSAKMLLFSIAIFKFSLFDLMRENRNNQFALFSKEKNNEKH
ncbi:hypothetical protein MHA_0501 [Mannheimia haemolytica PHL213]|nr:hypothetical protein MHA_0501 [Mannheimia haemolytica PHL213]